MDRQSYRDGYEEWKRLLKEITDDTEWKWRARNPDDG